MTEPTTHETPADEPTRASNEALHSMLFATRIALAAAEAERDQYRASLDAALEAVDQAQADHQADIDQITAALHRNATEQDWCSQYDQEVRALNGRLKRPIAARQVSRDVAVEGHVMAEFRSSFPIQISVEATEEEVREATLAEFKRRGLDRYDLETWDNTDLDPDDLQFDLNC